ncbi:MAG: M50 family metallopeptidase [bacterium]
MSMLSEAKKVTIWILLTESILILSTRLGAFLHEFVGHGLMAILVGGRFESFRLTLFAGGEARFTGNFGETAYLLVCLGGILTNLAAGLAALWLLRKRYLSFPATLFVLFLAGVCILSQLQYLILGAYYQYGDPACLAAYPSFSFLIWAGGLAVLAGFSFSFFRHFFRLQDVYFPKRRFHKRAVISLCLLGLPVLWYATLYHYAQTPLSSTAAVREARLRLQEKAEQIKIETKSEQSIDEIIEDLEPHPVMPWIMVIYFLAALSAFLFPGNVDRGKNFPPLPCSFLSIIPWILTSIVTLAVIVALWRP